MATNYKNENEMLNTILPGEVTIQCWKVEDGNRTLVEELQFDISEEQFNMALASYRSGEYEYMNQDKRLSALVEEFGGLARLFNDLDEDVEILVDYPEEVRNRRRLTREEIAYYKGEGRVECPEDDYKYVDDIDDIVNRAQYDVMTRAQKRDRYEFENDAEYRLYLITLYDYAQLDEFGDRKESDEIDC